MVRRLVAAVAAGLVAAFGAVIGLGSPAAAHGQFVSAVPVPGSEVTAPLERFFVYFTAKPTSNAYFAVTAPSGVRIDRLWSHGPTRPLDPPVHEWFHQDNGEWVTRSYDTAFSAMIPIAYWPEVGEYKVEYLSVASDGQPVRGSFTFTYSGPISELPADFRPQRIEPDPNLLTIAVTDAPTAPASGPPIEDVIAEQESGPGTWVLWVPAGLVLAGALAVLVFWWLRPRQARELLVARFGGRYAAPTPRRPLALPPGLAERLPGRAQRRSPAPGAGQATVRAASPGQSDKPDTTPEPSDTTGS